MPSDAEMRSALRAHIYAEAMKLGASHDLASRTADSIVRVADAKRWPPKFKGFAKAFRARLVRKLRARGLSECDAARAADILAFAEIERRSHEACKR